VIRRIAAIGLAALPLIFALDRWLSARHGPAPRQPVRTMVVVDAPIEAVWTILADIPLQPEWMRDMKQVELQTPGPTGVGTRAEATVRILGIAVRDPVEVVEFEPPRRFAIRHEGLFTGGGRISLESGSDGATTIVRWEEALAAPFLPELGTLVLSPILRAVFQADLHRLRRLVETGAADG
jgi:uncharacterized membrane protein